MKLANMLWDSEYRSGIETHIRQLTGETPDSGKAHDAGGAHDDGEILDTDKVPDGDKTPDGGEAHNGADSRPPKTDSAVPDYAYSFLIKDADMSKFNDGADSGTVVGYIGILLNTAWERFTGKYGDNAYRIADNLDEYLAETDVILDLFKYGAYR
jgi:hypothetical protein